MLKIFLVAAFLGVSLFAFSPLGYGSGANREEAQDLGIAAKPVDLFRVERAAMIDAALQLGRQAEVPLGIEFVDRLAFEKSVDVNLERTTVGHALDTILSELKGYKWGVSGNVIVITHERAPSGKQNLLNHVLKEFVIPRRCTLAEANDLLRMVLELDLDPRIRGFAGNYNPGSMERIIGPLTMRGVTVREVLNRLVSQRRNAAWIVQVPPGQSDRIPPHGLWTLMEYESFPRPYAGYLRHRVFGAGRETDKK